MDHTETVTFTAEQVIALGDHVAPHAGPAGSGQTMARVLVKLPFTVKIGQTVAVDFTPAELDAIVALSPDPATSCLALDYAYALIEQAQRDAAVHVDAAYTPDAPTDEAIVAYLTGLQAKGHGWG